MDPNAQQMRWDEQARRREKLRAERPELFEEPSTGARVVQWVVTVVLMLVFVPLFLGIFALRFFTGG